MEIRRKTAISLHRILSRDDPRSGPPFRPSPGSSARMCGRFRRISSFRCRPSPRRNWRRPRKLPRRWQISTCNRELRVMKSALVWHIWMHPSSAEHGPARRDGGLPQAVIEECRLAGVVAGPALLDAVMHRGIGAGVHGSLRGISGLNLNRRRRFRCKKFRLR